MRTVLNFLVIAALAATALGMYALANVDDYATQYVNDQLADVFAESGINASVREANFVSGVGLELRDLSLLDVYHQKTQQLFTAKSILIRFPTEFQDIVGGQVKPTGIDIDGVRINIDLDRIDDDFVRRLKTIPPRLPPSGDLVATRIRNSEIEMRVAELRDSILLQQIDVDVIPEQSNGQKKLSIDLQSLGGFAQQLRAKGNVDLNRRTWSVDVEQLVLQLSDRIMAMLPESEQFDKSYLAGVTGHVAFRARASAAFDDQEPRFAVRGRAINIAVNNDKLPGPIRNTLIDVKLDNRGVKLERLKGDYADGSFDIKYQQSGLLKRSAWQMSGDLKQVKFDHQLGMAVSGKCKKFCHDFSPSGSFDLQFEADSSGKKKITSQITDMAFSFHRFPYRVEHCVGRVKWIGDVLDFQVQSIEQGQLLEFGGRVNNPGEEATFRFEFGTEGRLPIDEKLIACLQKYPSMEQLVRDFRLAGATSGKGVVEKLVPNSANVNRDIRINLHDCRVRYQKFDYPMQDVDGSVKIDDDGFTFEDITGRSGSGEVVCNGDWNPRAGLRLAFICESTQLDRHLRNALTPDLQEVWDSFRPQGKLQSGRVFLDLPPGSPYADIRIAANLGDQTADNGSQGVTVNPTWFPYRFHNVTGNVEIGGGAVRVTNLMGQHGRSRLGFNGSGTYSSTGWSFGLRDMLAVQVKADDELLSAIPVDLAAAIRQLQYDGQFNLSGAMTFASEYSILAGNSQNSGPVQLVGHSEAIVEDLDVGWDVRLDIDQGSMLLGLGLPLENIFGSVRLTGDMRKGFSSCSGKVGVDSMTVYGLQVTNVQGPIWIDNYKTLAGKFAKTDPNEEAASLVGQVCGGKISFDGSVSHTDDYPFKVQTIVEKSRLEELAAELAPEMTEMSGDGYAYLQLEGKANELHTYQGRGNVHLQNAKIQELPVVLSLLKILNIKELNRTAFDSSNIDFSVKGNQLKLDRIELIGDAISLIGNGYLELMRHADINFYSVVGRNRFYIPLLSDLYRAGSQRIMWINITGPLQNLQINRKVLPGLDDSLRTLLGTGDQQSRGR